MPVDIVQDYSYLLLASSLVKGDVDPYAYQQRANDWLDRYHHNDDINWNWPSVTVKVFISSFFLCIINLTFFQSTELTDLFQVHVIAEHGGAIIKSMPATPG